MAASSSTPPFFGSRELDHLHHHQQQPPQQQQPQMQELAPMAPMAAPPQQPKKKRSLPGAPSKYPDAEVIALSPKTLMATNRFLCEVCNKGFQREQNLQLHRRGHNLPWKLKQKTNKDPVRKKVYLCPEPTCVHHDPTRALGDLTGIKKHFFRKHGEKKFKCDKCSKRYAVQSDWKAHSKTCGTREYRCDCGTLFSRRDSFITHRAFCDALAQETARNPPDGGSHVFLPVGPTPSLTQFSNNNQLMMGPSFQFPDHHTPAAQFNPLFGPNNTFRGAHNNNNNNNNFYFSSGDINNQQLFQGGGQLNPLPVDFNHLPAAFFPNVQDNNDHNQNNNNNNNDSTSNVLFGGPQMGPMFNGSPSQSPGMSATALLQKAAQMGSTSSPRTATATAILNKGGSTNTGKSSSSSSPPPKLFSGGGVQYGDLNDENTLHGLMMNSLNGGPCSWAGPTVEGELHHQPPNNNNNNNINSIKLDGMTRDFLGVGEIVRSSMHMQGGQMSNKAASDSAPTSTSSQTYGGSIGAGN